MAQLVVRNLDGDVKERLRERAARHGRSMEEEIREILSLAVLKDDTHEEGLGTRLVQIFSGSGVTLDAPIPELCSEPRPATFDE